MMRTSDRENSRLLKNAFKTTLEGIFYKLPFFVDQHSMLYIYSNLYIFSVVLGFYLDVFEKTSTYKEIFLSQKMLF